MGENWYFTEELSENLGENWYFTEDLSENLVENWYFTEDLSENLGENWEDNEIVWQGRCDGRGQRTTVQSLFGESASEGREDD